jgi:hypothetical protein
VLTCLITGVLASLEVYAAQLVWGDWKGFPDVDTAFVHVAGKAGGPVLFGILNATLLVANIGSGSGAHLGAARLLYGMGRSGALPPRFFGAIDPRRNIPRNNVILVGVLALIGGLLLSYQLGAEMLNFGAFIAFMGVNWPPRALLGAGGQGEEKRATSCSSRLPTPLSGEPALAGQAVWWRLLAESSTERSRRGAPKPRIVELPPE